MTVEKLYRLLGDLVGKGHGRKPVCIDKYSFQDNQEGDGCTILEVHNCECPVFVAIADGDGGVKYNKDGSESGRMTVILKG